MNERGHMQNKQRALRYVLVLILSQMWLVSPSPASAQESHDVRLRAGDMLRLDIKDEPTLGAQLVVGSDGSILFPLIGLVGVADRPFADVENEVRARYAKQLKDPVMQVTPIMRIPVTGEVRAPGLQLIYLNQTLADAIASAGGLGPN